MPRKYDYAATFVSNIIFAGVVIGFFVFGIGLVCIISFVVLLHNNFGLSSELAFNLAIFAILALMVVTLALIIGIPATLIVRHNNKVEKKNRGIQVANIDSMAGIEFEQYLKALLTDQGYSVRITQASGDLGVDLIASKNDEKIAIQAKRQTTKVSRRAISDAVAGMHHYGCNKAMVITNSYFSPGAIMLGQSTSCILVDRNLLAKWVIEYQNTSG